MLISRSRYQQQTGVVGEGGNNAFMMQSGQGRQAIRQMLPQYQQNVNYQQQQQNQMPQGYGQPTQR